MPTPSGVINLDLLKNFTYTVESPDLKVPLKDGVYSGDHITSRLVEPVAFGNLAGEGAPDAAVVLATNTGGSGTFFDLVVVLDKGGTPVEAAFAPFGDRQVVKNLQIVSGRIVLDYLTQGPKDGLCCPSEHRLRTYVLDGGALRLASEQILDSPETQATMVPHVIEIDQPVNGDPYTSPLTVRGRISEVPPEKKLGYRVTDFLSGYLLMEGDVPVEGEPGQPGTFSFELSPGPVTPGIIILAIVDVENGKLLGRSVVDLSTPHQ